MFYAEKEAKEFLRKEGFDLLSSIYVRDEISLKKSIKKFPIVMKVMGKKIVHKKKLGGVKVGIKNFCEVLEEFKKMKNISGSEGVIIQEQIIGREFLLGIKKTPDFGHIFVFGSGGSSVEKDKDVSFRVYPVGKDDIKEMFVETKIFNSMNQEEKELVLKTLLKFNSLVKKFPKILELDINPLMIDNHQALIVDARIVFE